MNDTLEEDYLKWLKPQVYNQDGTVKTYDGMLLKLYDKEFVWVVPNDDNRLEDAVELRREFMRGAERDFYKGISILEVLIGLSRRLEFMAGETAQKWAWELIRNLGLNKMTDPLNDRKDDLIDGILETLIWRNYRRNGYGGFFPLNNPREDQTKVELWYQMSAYVNEMMNL